MVLIRIALGGYMLASVAYGVHLATGKYWASLTGFGVLAAAGVANWLAIVGFWLQTGRPPLAGVQEFLLPAVAFLVLIEVLLEVFTSVQISGG